MRSPQFFQLAIEDEATTVRSIVRDLCARPASIAPKFFYDELGSRLFDAITALPEYYPTRTEQGILARHATDMARVSQAQIGPRATLVDLGAGNCEKASRLFDAFAPSRYVAVDISADYLRRVLGCLQREHPDLDMVGVGTDFASHLSLPLEHLTSPSLMFYPGSSIGNFKPELALAFLRQARALGDAAGGGGLLIGVDLVKPSSLLEPAYDDQLGITAAFNLNVLMHLNRRVGSDFDLHEWKHVAFFDREASRIEMHLEARRRLVVQMHSQGTVHERHFEAGERILTEYSYKWQPEAFEGMLREAGYTRVTRWTDEQAWFAVFLAT